MPNLNSKLKSHRRVQETVKDRMRRGRATEKAKSFRRSRADEKDITKPRPRRPRTVSERHSGVGFIYQASQDRLSKLLLNVSVLGVVGPVQVIIAAELTVGDLIATTVKQYIKDWRRPILPTENASNFDLHYSQFDLESLDTEEKLMTLGSRHFFLCPRKLPSSVGCSVMAPVTARPTVATT